MPAGPPPVSAEVGHSCADFAGFAGARYAQRCARHGAMPRTGSASMGPLMNRDPKNPKTTYVLAGLTAGFLVLAAVFTLPALSPVEKKVPFPGFPPPKTNTLR